MFRTSVFIVCLLAACFTVVAQKQFTFQRHVTGTKLSSGKPVFEVISIPHTRKYHFVHFNSANGLRSNIVKNIIQDYKGYVWLATLDGLQRYDGNKFLTFRNEPGNPHSVPADVIGQVMEDGHHNLWVLGGGKVGIFNTSTFTFTNVPIADHAGLMSNYDPNFSSAMLRTDNNGDMLLFVINMGGYRYDSNRRQFVPVPYLTKPPGWWLQDLYCSASKGQYIMGTHQGFIIYNEKTGHTNYAGHNPDNIALIEDLKNETFIVNVIGYQGNYLWYSNWPSTGMPFLHSYNIVTRERREYNLSALFQLGYHEIQGALLQENGRLWAYGRTFIAEYNETDKSFRLMRNEYVDEQSIRFDQVYNMFEDKQHNIWVSTENGAFIFNPDKELFNNYSLVRPDGSGMIDGPVITAAQVGVNEIWIGCWGTGLYAYDTSFNPIALPPALQRFGEGMSLWSIQQHEASNTIWVGMQEGGLLVYHTKTGKVDWFYDKIFAGSTIRQVVEDRQGNLWFGMQGGHIVKWDAAAAGNDAHKGFKLIRKRDGARIYKLMIDHDGFLWAGSLTQGLFKYNTATEELLLHISKDGPAGKHLLDNTVFDIVQHDNSTLLIAGGAINVLNTRTNNIYQITTADGLPSNNVQCLQKDKQGIYWIGMAHGLCRMNFEKKIFSLYDRRDGMAYDNFNPGGVNVLPDGRLVFSTDRSLTVLNPLDIKKVPLPDEVLLTDIRLSNRSLPVDSVVAAGGIILPYDNAAVTIEFSILDFMKQKKAHYRYMLENLDKTWKEASSSGQAIYTYLPPGSYTFLVKAENTDGIPGKNITAINITITPPFWQTWWFYCILALIVAAILYWIDRERVNKMKALQRVRTQIAVNLHDEVNTTLSNINLLSEMARLKADKDIARSKEYISQISTKSQRMMDAMDDILWSISPQNDSMEKTIARMKDYAVKLEKQYHIHIHFRSEEGVEKLKLDMKQRHELFVIYKQCVDDTVVHFKCSNLDVFIDRDKNKNHLSLKLRGESETDIVYAATPYPGTLAIQKRVESIGATLDMIEDKRQLSMILQLPLS